MESFIETKPTEKQIKTLITLRTVISPENSAIISVANGKIHFDGNYNITTEKFNNELSNLKKDIELVGLARIALFFIFSSFICILLSIFQTPLYLFGIIINFLIYCILNERRKKRVHASWQKIYNKIISN